MMNDPGGSDMSVLAKEFGIPILLNSVVVIGLRSVSQILLPHAMEIFGHKPWIPIVACIVTLVVCLPFLRAILSGSAVKIENPKTANLARIKRISRTRVGISVVYGVVMIGVVIGEFTNIQTFSGIVLIALGSASVIFSRYSEPLYRAIDDGFWNNLNDKEILELERGERPALAPWDATLAEFLMSPDSELVGKRLDESAFKENTGATIAMIERGSRRILAPNRAMVLLPSDKVYVIGTDEQLGLAQARIEVQLAPTDSNEDISFGLDTLVLGKDSNFVGKTIRDCGLREATHGLIVGIERDAQRILNPDSTMTLLPEDRLWIVGDTVRIRMLKAGQPLPPVSISAHLKFSYTDYGVLRQPAGTERSRYEPVARPFASLCCIS